MRDNCGELNVREITDRKRMGTEAKRQGQSEIGDTFVAFLAISFIGATLFFICGGSLDGLMYSQWPLVDDHPTNWNAQ
jgi:hypothetical protein